MDDYLEAFRIASFGDQALAREHVHRIELTGVDQGRAIYYTSCRTCGARGEITKLEAEGLLNRVLVLRARL